MVSTKKITIGAVAALLLGGVVFAVASAEGSNATMNLSDNPCAPAWKAKRAAGPAGEESPTPLPAEERPDACGKRQGHGHKHPRAPPFTVDGSSVSGRFVSFNVDAAAGAITDYVSRGPFADAVLFREIRLGDYEAGTIEPKSKGPVYGLKGEGVGFIAFNAPNAAWGLRASEANTLTLRPGEGITVTVSDDGASAKLTRDGHEATLRTRGGATIALDGDAIVIDLPEGSAVGFAIDGYPHVVKHEKRFLRMLARHREAQTEADPATGM